MTKAELRMRVVEALAVGVRASLKRSVAADLVAGIPVAAAAQLAGVAPSTIYRWLKADPAFRALVAAGLGGETSPPKKGVDTRSSERPKKRRGARPGAS